MAMYTDKDGEPKIIPIVITAVILISALLAFFILNPIVKIGPGKRGVVLQWGAVTSTILGEGIHWVTPIAQDVEKMDVTIQKVEVKQATASSKDLQSVHTNITLNYRLDPDKVNKIYQTMKKDYIERVIYPAILEYLKASTAKFTAEELITKREKVKEEFFTHLSSGLKGNDILVNNVFITDFGFSPDFQKAIENKVTAEQEALQQKNVLERKKYEAEQVVVKAKADAEAIRIQAQAITQQGGRDYVQLKAVEKWNGALPTSMIPGSAVPFLNLQYDTKH